MSTPAGWYPDPQGAMRWWDGYRWTDAVQPWAPAPPAKVPEGTPTSTPWIWLIVVLPVVSAVVSIGYLSETWAQMMRAFESALDSAGGSGGGLGPQFAMYTSPWYLISLGTGLVVWGLSAWFAYLDQRTLIALGYPRTFHWAWGFLGLVYIIGRSVVVRRQTGRGLAPLWTFIGIEVAWIAFITIWTVQLFSQMMHLAAGQFGAA